MPFSLRKSVRFVLLPQIGILVDPENQNDLILNPLETIVLLLFLDSGNGQYTRGFLSEIIGLGKGASVNFISHCEKLFSAYLSDDKANLPREISNATKHQISIIVNSWINDEWNTNYRFPHPLGCVVVLTNKCGYSCQYCFNSSGPNKQTFLDGDVLCNRLDELDFSLMHRFVITGGEPTLHPQLGELLRYLAKKKQTCFISLSSNGASAHPSDLFLWKKSIDLVQFSVDTLDEDLGRRLSGKNWQIENTKDCIKIARHINMPIQIKVVLTRINASPENIDQIINYCIGAGILKIVFTVISPTHGGRGNFNLIPTTKQFRDLRRTLNYWHVKARHKISIIIPRLGYRWQDVYKVTRCDFLRTVFTILHNGDLVLCDKMSDSQKAKIGNIYESSILARWTDLCQGGNATFRLPLGDNRELDPICKGCGNFQRCQTGCFNAKLLEGLSFFSPDPRCDIFRNVQTSLQPWRRRWR